MSIINGITKPYQRLALFARTNRPQLIIGLLILLFIIAYFAPRIFISIHSGQAGILYRRLFGGTDTAKVYGEGLHVIFPWDRLYVYDLRIQEAHPTIDVLTKKGLTVTLDVSIRYRPERKSLGLLHQNVGTDYLEKILIPEVTSALRTAVGEYTAEELFSTNRTILEGVADESVRKAANLYITLDGLIIRTIKLPPAIKSAVEVKIEQQHLAEAYEFRLEREKQEAKRKEIEALGHKTYNETIAPSLSESILRWKGIDALRELASSESAKVIVLGNRPDGPPIILGTDK